MAENMMDNDYIDIETIVIPLEDGTELECAIMDEFEMDGQGYMVLSPIEGEEIGEDLYVYRYTEDGDDVTLDYIDDEEELERVNDFYSAMMDEIEE